MERIGPYVVGELVASGGTGSVLRALGPDGRWVALKVFDVRLRSAFSAARFEKEARIRIDHPNVVRVLDAGTHDETPWIALELLEGEPLSARFAREGRLAPDDVVEISRQVCRGLEAAHAQGVVHRDLKPENLFACADGTIKILDFGIALLDTDPERLTTTGMIIGTPWYLSPEQARGDRALDVRADLWSLGCVMYEALAGKTPFERDGMLATVLAILREELEPLALHAPSVPAPLAMVIERCLVKEPSYRWTSAERLRRALEEVDLSQAPVVPGDHITRPSIAPGEQRIVAVMLAEGVSEPNTVETWIQRRGGTYLPLYGNRAVGLFGSESWEGDELSRAATAALDVQHVVKRLAIAAGRAFSHGTGISGEALSAAEQGCRAAVDGIVVDSRSARLLKGGFLVETRADGITRVVARLDQSSAMIIRTGDSLPPPAPVPAPPSIVGRESEVAQMEGAVRTWIEEERGVGVLVVGPPGIGKSRLREELDRMIKARAPEATVLFARGDPLGRTAARSLVAAAVTRHARLRALRENVPSLDEDAPEEERRAAVRALAAEALDDPALAEETVPFLGELLGVRMEARPELEAAHADPQLMGERLDMAVRDFMGGLAARGPLVLAFEDVQWSDGATLRLAEELLEQLGEQPFLLFATARPWMDDDRPGFLEGPDVVRIEPRPLRGKDAARLATAVAGRELPPVFMEALADRCGGNPLFIEQTIAEAVETGALDDGSDLPVPLTVEGAIQSRLDHLPPLEKELCKRASVLGRPFSVQEVEALGSHDAQILLDQLRRRGIVSVRSAARVGRGRQYRFRIALFGEVSYRMLTGDVKMALHRRAGEILDEAGYEDSEEIAYHYELGDEPKKASKHYVAASLAAFHHGDLGAILRCSDKALKHGVPHKKRLDLHLARAEALQFMRRLPEQEEELDAALEYAVRPQDQARVWSQRVGCVVRQGRPEEALRAAETAVELTRLARDPELEVRALTLMVNVLAERGRLDRAKECLASASATEATLGPAARAALAAANALVAYKEADLVLALAQTRDAARLWRDAGDLIRAVRSEGNVGLTYLRLGAYDDAVRVLERVVQSSQRVGNRGTEAHARCNLAVALFGRGDAMRARLEAEIAVRVASATNNVRLQAMCGVDLLRVSRRLVDPSTLAAEAERAAQYALANDLSDPEAIARAVQAEARLALGDVDGALEASERAMALLDDLGSVEGAEEDILLVRMCALRAAGREQEAESMHRRMASRRAELAACISDERLRAALLASRTP